MSRAKPNEVATPLSLFPFIGVLLSTMGALLFVLIVVSRSAHDSAMRDVASERAALENVAPPADPEGNTLKLQQINDYVARLKAVQDEAERRLRDDQLRLSHSEDHMRRLQDQLVALKAASIELDAFDKEHLDDRRQAEREVARLRELIEETQTTIKSLKESKAVKKRSFAIIPYDGPNSTRRRPIYIECTNDEVILRPEGIRLTVQDFVPPLDSGNPLAAALRAAREQLVREAGGIAPGKQTEPYPLILIRPNGIEAYYAVREAIASWDADFGYEFVGDDWKLEFQPANPQLARLEQQAIDQARARRRVLAAAAPRAFRSGSGLGASSFDEDDDGMFGGGGGGSGGAGGGGYGTSGGGPTAASSASVGGAGGSNPTGHGGGTDQRQRGATAAGGADRYSFASNAARDGALVAQGGGGAGSRPIGGSTPNGGGANQSAPDKLAAYGEDPGGPIGVGPANGQAGATSMTPNGANQNATANPITPIGGTAATFGSGSPSAAAGGSPGADGSAGQGGSSMGNSMPGMRPTQPHSMPDRITPQDFAQTKGGNWALAGKSPAAVPVRRSIQAAVRDDRLALLPESGDQSAGGSEIPLKGPTARAINDLVSAVQKRVGDWGMAGQGLYWRPVLVLNVGPDGGQRAEEITQLLKDSGIDVRTSAATQQPPSPAPAKRSDAPESTVKQVNEELIEIPGQDSFLDVITNIVGILILLVLVVGMKTSRSVANAARAEIAPQAVEQVVDDKSVEAAYRSAVAQQRDVVELARRTADVHGQSQMREQERAWMTTFVASAESEVGDRRKELTTEQQRDFDLRRQLIAAQQQLDDLGREQIALLSEESTAEVVQSLPTPLAKAVTGQEMHLRLAEGHVAVVPFEELKQELDTHLERNAWRLREQGAMTGTVGPINNFRLRYRIQLTQVSVPTRAGVDQVHTVPNFKVEFLPMSPRLGEPVDQAVLPASELRRVIKRFSPATATVTIWTYPDSFAEFRQLKKALFDLGYTSAGRPLPEGVLIGGSPTGSKSAAQ